MVGAAPSNPELVEKLKADIRKSGFPLEVHVLNVCSTKNTGRMPGLKYEYLDKVREIDLVAFYEAIDLEPPRGLIPQHTVTNLIIECKKSEAKPWVFFSSPAYGRGRVLHSLKYFSELDSYFAGRHLPPLLAQIYPAITKSHYVDASLPRCFSYCEAFKNTEKPSEIYTAIDSVIRYLSYRRRSRENRRKKSGVFSEFYLPIIVFEGCLFEASISGAEIDLHQRSHLQLRTWQGEALDDLCVIDVVTRDHFQEFFNELEHFHDELVSAIRSLKFSAGFRAASLASIKKPSLGFYSSGMVAMMMHDAKRRARKTKKSRP
jgi:hypothetical protein